MLPTLNALKGERRFVDAKRLGLTLLYTFSDTRQTDSERDRNIIDEMLE